MAVSKYFTLVAGLSNELLEQQTAFSNNVVNVIKNWLSLSESPICFVAHNGDRFDYPILRAELHNASGDLSEEIVCVDSLKAFKALDAIDDVAKPPEPEDVPAVFDDGYDELLCEIADEMENKLKQLTPAEMQKLNEITPKKQKLSGMAGSHKENNRPKKNLFQKKRYLYRFHIFICIIISTSIFELDVWPFNVSINDRFFSLVCTKTI